MSDPRAETSGILVIVRYATLAPYQEVLLIGSSIFVFLCPVYLVCACANFLN